jgi:hypothetical protein
MEGKEGLVNPVEQLKEKILAVLKTAVESETKRLSDETHVVDGETEPVDTDTAACIVSTPEGVAKILSDAGIDTSGLEVKVEIGTEGYEEYGGPGGNAYNKYIVTIKQAGNVVVKEEFIGPFSHTY